MSKTYDIVCHDCKVTLWIGQGPLGPSTKHAYIYSDQEHRQRLRDFFFGHMYHRLEFGDSQALDEKDIHCEYTSLDQEGAS